MIQDVRAQQKCMNVCQKGYCSWKVHSKTIFQTSFSYQLHSRSAGHSFTSKALSFLEGDTSSSVVPWALPGRDWFQGKVDDCSRPGGYYSISQLSTFNPSFNQLWYFNIMSTCWCRHVGLFLTLFLSIRNESIGVFICWVPSCAAPSARGIWSHNKVVTLWGPLVQQRPHNYRVQRGMEIDLWIILSVGCIHPCHSFSKNSQGPSLETTKWPFFQVLHATNPCINGLFIHRSWPVQCAGRDNASTMLSKSWASWRRLRQHVLQKVSWSSNQNHFFLK